MRVMRLCAALAGVLLASGLPRAQAPAVTFTRLYDLRPNEGVFAYARISPDGRTLAYASEMPDPARGGLGLTPGLTPRLPRVTENGWPFPRSVGIPVPLS